MRWDYIRKTDVFVCCCFFKLRLHPPSRASFISCLSGQETEQCVCTVRKGSACRVFMTRAIWSNTDTNNNNKKKCLFPQTITAIDYQNWRSWWEDKQTNRPENMQMNSFGDFMFLYFDDVIRVLSGNPIHDLIFSTVARTHAISEKPDTNSRYFQTEFGFRFGDY